MYRLAFRPIMRRSLRPVALRGYFSKFCFAEDGEIIGIVQPAEQISYFVHPDERNLAYMIKMQ